MILCAGRMEQFAFAYPIGIGLVESAINLSRLCLFDPPEYLLFVGTAGSYGKYGIGDIITSTEATQIELSFLQNKSYTPIENAISITDGLLANETKVNSSNYISTDATLARQLEKMGVGAENMEFFAVMAVAQNFQIPAAGIFCITNFCNEKAHEEFKANHPHAMEKLDRLMRSRFDHLITPSRTDR